MIITSDVVDRAIAVWRNNPAEDWTELNGAEHWRESMRRLLDYLFLPPPGGVPIRIAVAFDLHGLPDVCVMMPEVASYVPWNILAEGGHTHRAGIITATVAPPVVAEIEGSVQPAGGE